ncbi:MAG: hypothetical protein F4029_17765 [Gammaproteobacteria bacterium]|nr:hypothetical protein [Gammaproteobacteria bacterium]MYF28875.1 hypothetical protein [Gammaproteobacteria bacterium]MYK48065.1 hypothetical protein [Gammaproteobacteria bacterium]
MRNGLLIAGVFLLAPVLSVFAGEKAGVMEKLAALEGDWMLLDEDGRETEVVGSSFRLTAGGSAVVETMFPNSSDGHEMVNMYHADGNRVLMTHYCAAGNQPRLVVEATDDENRLELRFESITNLATPDSTYMSEAVYVFHGDDRLTTRWRSMSGGELTEETTTIELKRRK